jgi:hypothetical protein
MPIRFDHTDTSGGNDSGNGSGGGGNGGGGGGGLASKLVSMAIDQKAAQEKKSALAPLSAARLVMQTYERDPDAVDPEMLQWSLGTLSDIDKVMQGQPLGSSKGSGGGGGSGGGKGGGIKSKLGGIGSLLANMITGGLSGTMQANARRRSGMAEAERRSGASMPQGKPLVLTPEERQNVKDKQAEAVAAEQDKIKRERVQRSYKDEIKFGKETLGWDETEATKRAREIADQMDRQAEGTAAPPRSVAPTAAKPAPAPKQTAQDRLARSFLDSGRAKTPEEANRMAADMQIQLENAKLKAAQSRASGGGGPGGASMFSPQEMKALAHWGVLTGQNPSFGLSANNPDRRMYYKTYAEELLGGGAGEAAESRGAFKGLSGSLADLQKLRGRVYSFEETARANIDLAITNGKKVGRSGSSLVNELWLNMQGKLEDYPELAAFRTDVFTAANEYARVVNSATGNGVSTDNAREEAMRIFNQYMPAGALEGAANEMYVDMDNRMKGLDGAINGLRQALSEGGTGKPSGGGPPKPGSSGTTHFTEGSRAWDIPADKIEAFKSAHPNAKAQ